MSTLQLSIGYRRGVPHIRQAELAECGLACLAMILGHHGQAADIAGLRRRFPQSARGVSLERLMRMADESGLSPRAVKLPLESLPNLALPAVLHWDFQHFVVLEKVRNGRALIADPAGEKRWMTFDELSPHFTGVALELRTTPNFQPGKRGDRLKVRQLWTKLSGLRRALAQTLLLTITLQVFTLASPYYMQLAIDSALPAFDKNLLTLLAMAFGMLALFNVVATWLRSFVLLAVGTSLGYALSINIVRHLLRLPIDWFSKRSVGDILSRFQSIAPIQQLLTQSAVTVLVDGIVALATLTVMFIYSPALALLAIGAFAALLLIRAITYPMQRRALQDTIVTGAKEQSFLIETLRGMQTVRLFNQETQRHALWQGRLTDSVNARVQQAKIGIWQTGATGVVAGIENVAGVWLAIAFVMEGALSVGMVFAFFAYKMQFQAKAASLVDQAIALRLIGLHLERLSDIALAPKDHGFDQLAAGAPDLTGRIELRNVGYAFAEGEPSVISGLDLDIRPGEFVAIVGPSGGGKSTLLKILLGLLRPSSGEILIDGVPLSAFGYENYRSQIGAVLQDDHLFAGSLAENIAFFDSATDWPRIVEAATAAAIHEDIVRMPMGYATLVGDMGASLSCGQRQRILLARALYRRPKLLVMDEGTSFLDEDNERAVNAAIAALGITRIVVTHRLASVATADRILVKTSGHGLCEQIETEPAATRLHDPQSEKKES